MVNSNENIEKQSKKITRWSKICDDSIEINRTIIVDMLPSTFNAEIISSFLSGVIFTIFHKSNNIKNKERIIENIIECDSKFFIQSEDLNNNLDDQKKRFVSFRITFTSLIYALICLKLDGLSIGSSSEKISCRRPDEYVCSSEGEPLDKFFIPNIIKTSINRLNENEKCIIRDLPIDINEEIIKDQLEKIGKLKSLNIIYDPITGVSKGVGSFEYEESNLCQKAIDLLNGKPIESTNNGIWNIQLSSGIISKLNINNNSNISTVNDSNLNIIQDNNEYIHVSNLSSSMSYKLFNNPLLYLIMKYSKIVGETPSQIIQLLNVFLPEELVDDTEFNSIVDSVKSEAETYGTILEIFCPRPKNIEEYTNCSGAGKIFIYFSDITSARRAQYQFNGRIFDNIKTISATFYPLEKYLRREYNLITYLAKN